MYNMLYNICSCLRIALYVQGVSEALPIVCILCLEYRPARQLLRRPFHIPMNYADLMHLSSYEETHGETDGEMDEWSVGCRVKWMDRERDGYIQWNIQSLHS